MRGTREERYARRALVARLMNDALKPFDGPSVVAAVEFRREQYGLNSAEMAEVLGLTKGHYSEFVQGKRSLPAFAAAMAFRVGVPAECLFQTDVAGRSGEQLQVGWWHEGSFLPVTKENEALGTAGWSPVFAYGGPS